MFQKSWQTWQYFFITTLILMDFPHFFTAWQIIKSGSWIWLIFWKKMKSWSEKMKKKIFIFIFIFHMTKLITVCLRVTMMTTDDPVSWKIISREKNSLTISGSYMHHISTNKILPDIMIEQWNALQWALWWTPPHFPFPYFLNVSVKEFINWSWKF